MPGVWTGKGRKNTTALLLPRHQSRVAQIDNNNSVSNVLSLVAELPIARAQVWRQVKAGTHATSFSSHPQFTGIVFFRVNDNNSDSGALSLVAASPPRHHPPVRVFISGVIVSCLHPEDLLL